MTTLRESLEIADSILRKYGGSTKDLNIIAGNSSKSYCDIYGNVVISRNHLSLYNSYEVAFIIIHEYLHYILLYEMINYDKFGSDYDVDIFKLASDVEINQITYKLFHEFGYSQYLSNRFLCLICFPNKYNLPFNKRWYYYYYKLKKMKEEGDERILRLAK